MRRYPEYKESDVEWIGEIPKHWTISKVKHKFESLDNLRTPLNSETRGSMKLKIYDYYGASGIIDKVEDYIFDEPLILIGEDGANLYLRSTPLAFKATGKYWINNHAHVLKPKYGNMDYLTNMLESLDYTHYITGAAQPKLTSEHLMNIAVIIPPPPEQTQIANFLNRKTRQIDELLRIKERRIELLQEQRTVLINQAVTKGLDPNVEMKPSGVEWIGEIPAHWKIIKLRYLGVLQNGISKDSDSFGLGCPFLSYGDVYNNDTLPTQVEGLVKSTKADKERYSVKETDVFFTRTSETIEEIGISSTCMKTIENCVFSGFLIRFRNTSTVLTKNFSKYYFPSHLPRIFLAREVNIVTRSSLSQELLKRLPVLLPSPDEQKEITNFLDRKTQQIDELISAEHRKIELLTEYRQSLISEAVTGKIDVRSEV